MVNMVKVVGKHDNWLKGTKTRLYNAIGSIFTRHKDISIKEKPLTVRTTTTYKVISPLKRFNQLQAVNSLQSNKK